MIPRSEVRLHAALPEDAPTIAEIWHPGALEHHPEKHRQITALADQMQQVPDAHHAAAREFIARLTSTARITSESKACIIISAFAFPLRIAVSVGLKTVLVLNARNR